MQDSRNLQIENSVCSGEQAAEMSASEKSRYRSKLIFVLLISLGMAVSMPAIMAFKFGPHNPIWSRPNSRSILLILLVNSALFLIIPGVILFRILRRKIKFGSYFPTGEDLKKYRARRRGPEPLWRRVLSAAGEVVAAVGFTSDAMHRSHGSVWEWAFASLLWLFAAITVLGIIGALPGVGKPGRREGFACPGCGAAPPTGIKWKCKQCGKGFDTFLARAVCPHCGMQHPTTMCGNCKAMHPMNDWIYAYTSRNCGAASG